MSSTSSEITVLLMLEAIDKASQVLEAIGGKLGALGDAAKQAADKAALTGDELEAAQVKAEAAANAAAAAQDAQAAAQARLAQSSVAVRDAQNAAADAAARLAAADAAIAAGVEDAANVAQVSYDDIAKSAALAADAVKAATAEQIVALDALKGAETELAARTEESSAARDAANTDMNASGAAMKGVAAGAAITAAAVAGIGYESVKAAASFQSATTVLVTSGGETAANIGMVRQGILSLAASTGTATADLTKGMYMIGSAGYTGAQGLTVLKAAAQGAKAEGADLGTVGNALTTVMKDYHQSAASAVPDMNQMIAVVQNGKTTTEALAASLSAVLPTAAAAGLSFQQVGGAMATMTGEGISAQQSAQDLSSTISALQKANAPAVTEMQNLGLSSNQVSMDLGKQGLTGTMQELTSAIAAHTRGGQVLISTYQNAKTAAADANTEIKAMPPNLQSLAQKFLDGSVTAKQWRADLQALTPTQATLMGQFATTAEKANSFNQYLKSGAPAAQTYNAAMSTMLNGVTGLHTALALSGGNMATFQSNVASVGAAAKGAGSDVNGWAEIQGTMNQKLAELKQTAETASISLGTALLPMVTKLLDLVMKIVTPIADWIDHNRKLAAVLLLVVGALATGITVFVLLAKAVEAVKAAMVTFGAVTEGLEFNPVIAAVTAIAIVALLIVTHWSTVKKWLAEFWGWLKGAFDDAVRFVKGHVNEMAAALTVLLGPIGLVIAAALEIATHWKAVKAALAEVWDWMKSAASAVAKFFEGVWDGIAKPIEDEWNKISGDLSSIWQSLVTIWNATGGALISTITRNWATIEAVFRTAWAVILGVVRPPLEMLKTITKAELSAVELVFRLAWDVITTVVKGAWDVISGEVKGALDLIKSVIEAAWDVVKGIVKAAWDVVTTIVNVALDLITGTFKMFADLVTGKWSKLWADVKGTVTTVWHDISSFFSSILADIESTVSGAASSIWNGFTNGIWAALGGIGKGLSAVWSGVVDFFKDAGKWLWNAGTDIVNGLIGGIKSMGSSLIQTVTTLGGLIPKWKGPPEKDKVMLVANGQLIMQGLITGIDSQSDALREKLEQITGSITATVNPVAGGSLGAGASRAGTAASSAGYGAGGVTIVIEGGNTLMSDSDIDKFAQKIGNRIATSIGPGGGLKFQMR